MTPAGAKILTLVLDKLVGFGKWFIERKDKPQPKTPGCPPDPKEPPK